MVKVGQALLSFDEGATAGATAAQTAPAPATKALAPSAQAPVAAASATPAGARSPAPSAPAQMSVAAATSGDTSPATRALAAPSTRRQAREMGVDLSQISGTGPNGRVMREDLDRAGTSGTGATAAGSPAPVNGAQWARPAGAKNNAALEERTPFRGLRKKISEKMSLSKSKAAHFTYFEECDATELVRLRSQAKEVGAASGIKVTYLPFVMKAMVAALRRYPILNSTLDEEKGELVYKHYYNIGLSVQTEDGLTAPVIKDVEHKSILQISKDIQEVVERARQKKLTLDDLHGSTITLTNVGSIGGMFATPIINFPEVAILGLNKIARRPVVVQKNGKEEIVIRDWTYFALSLDHRIVDGAIGAEFLKLFIKYIENPSLLLVEM